MQIYPLSCRYRQEKHINLNYQHSKRTMNVTTVDPKRASILAIHHPQRANLAIKHNTRLFQEYN